MRSRVAGLAVLSGLVAMPLAAQSGKAPINVSVTVTRSCRVASAPDRVAVTCGKRPMAVQVVTPDGKGAPQSIAGGAAITRRPGEPVTINF